MPKVGDAQKRGGEEAPQQLKMNIEFSLDLNEMKVISDPHPKGDDQIIREIPHLPSTSTSPGMFTHFARQISLVFDQLKIAQNIF